MRGSAHIRTTGSGLQGGAGLLGHPTSLGFKVPARPTGETMGGAHWSVKVYDSGGIVFRAWPVGRPELKACVSEATRFMRRTSGVFIVVRVDWRWVNGR